MNDYYVMTPFPAGSFFYFCFTAPSARLKRKHVCSLPEKMEQPEIESRITACPFDLHLPIVHGRASKRPLTHHILPLPPVSLCTTAATASKSSRVPHFSPFVIWYHPPLFIFFFVHGTKCGSHGLRRNGQHESTVGFNLTNGADTHSRSNRGTSRRRW